MILSPFHSEPESAVLGWIDRVIEGLGDGVEELELALTAEVCAVICADSAPNLSPSTRTLVTRARAIAARVFDHLGDRAFDLPGLLLLLAAVAEQAVFGEPAPPLAQYAKSAAFTLRNFKTSSKNPGYLAPRLLLSRLGLAAGVCVPKGALSSGLARHLLSEPAYLEEGLYRVDAASHCGLRPLLGPPSLRRALGSILLCRLQDYDLGTACRVLRALIYLGEREKGALVSQVSHFLLAQQNEEGGFGFLESESASLACRFPGTRAELRFRLGVTICTLWTLAECHGNGYRLFRDLGHGLTASEPADGSMASIHRIIA